VSVCAQCGHGPLDDESLCPNSSCQFSAAATRRAFVRCVAAGIIVRGPTRDVEGAWAVAQALWDRKPEGC